MREILFKAKVKWNGNHLFAGDWIEGFFVKSPHDIILSNNFPSVEWVDSIQYYDKNNGTKWLYQTTQIDPETLCQYTEVDQNYDGIKIFDGDKLDFCVFDCNGNDKAYIGYVVYTYGTYLVIDINDEENLWELGWIMAQDDEAKVIGNIHDKESD